MKEVNFIATFEEPIHATFEGRPVRLLATGDIEGMSPGYLYVDENGTSQWAPISKFQIVDLDVLPVSLRVLAGTR